jgi:hypothetical protein
VKGAPGAESMRPARAPDCVLVYDGSFPGLLCAVAETEALFRTGGALPAVRPPSGESDLFETAIDVPRDQNRARRVGELLATRGPAGILRTGYEAYCSDLPGKDTAVCRVLARILLDAASDVRHSRAPARTRALPPGGIPCPDFERSLDLSDPWAADFLRAARRTGAQAHLVQGLLRFAECADGTMYAVYGSECRVLELVAGHFASRFAASRFVIHDRGRGEAVLHAPGGAMRFVRDFRLLDGSGGSAATPASPEPSSGEAIVRALWQRYFGAVAIRERRNARLQAGKMPKKYWVDLPEMDPVPSHVPATAGSTAEASFRPAVPSDRWSYGSGSPGTGAGNAPAPTDPPS